MKNKLTAMRLRELLRYAPETGALVRLTTTRYNARAGGVAGSLIRCLGYREVWVDGRKYYAHRLVWLHVTGTWPKHAIDHINHDPSDNRFCNLREATKAQNAANSLVQSRSISGVKGAFKSGRKWTPGISINGKLRHLGSFDTPEEASLSYAYAAYGLRGEFARPHWRDVLGNMRGVLTITEPTAFVAEVAALYNGSEG